MTNYRKMIIKRKEAKKLIMALFDAVLESNEEFIILEDVGAWFCLFDEVKGWEHQEEH